MITLSKNPSHRKFDELLREAGLYGWEVFGIPPCRKVMRNEDREGLKS